MSSFSGNEIKTVPDAARPNLYRGSSGNDVEHLQSLLNSYLGYRIPMIRHIAIDGCFGQDTFDAVSLFQYKMGLPITGRVDSIVWNELEESVATPGLKKIQTLAVPLLSWSRYPDGCLSEPQNTLAEIAVQYLGVECHDIVDEIMCQDIVDKVL